MHVLRRSLESGYVYVENPPTVRSVMHHWPAGGNLLKGRNSVFVPDVLRRKFGNGARCVSTGLFLI